MVRYVYNNKLTTKAEISQTGNSSKLITVKETNTKNTMQTLNWDNQIFL